MEKPAEPYDVIILGTGYIECTLGTLLAKEGRRVLILDRERFSGGANGSISSLEELQQAFKERLPKKDEEWNVDLIPKLFVGEEKMKQLLQHLGVKLDTKAIQNVSLASQLQLVKVPDSEHKIAGCSLISSDEKEPYRQLVVAARTYAKDTVSCESESIHNFLQKRRFSTQTQKLLLHGMLAGKQLETSDELFDNLGKFCDVNHYHASAVSYPMYGLGEIVNGLLKRFSSLGGRCMLNRPISSIRKSDGVFHVSARGLTAMAPVVVGDASYFEDAVELTHQVARGLCILKHKVGDSQSTFITIPGCEFEKENDLYLLVIGAEHGIAPQGMFVAYLSTLTETADPEQELKPALAHLGKISAISVRLDGIYKKKTDEDPKLLVTASYDARMSWQQVHDNVTSLYEKITKKKLTLR